MTTETHMPDIITARHFTRRPLTVAAVHYDGSNAAELKALLGSSFGLFKVGPQVLTQQGWTPISVGEVAVLGPGGTVDLMNGADFAREYAEVAHA